MSSSSSDRVSSATLLDRVVVAVSIFGGLVILATAIMVTVSITGRWTIATRDSR